ncbi:hypothetical protein SDD15_004525 [Salmonella enterica]|nr:hypothetical protein [Salmonella enterica]ELU8076052.1 hypothetical protein [Salmonella enterica]
MAERHSIDHPPGSQDLSSAFMHHYMQHGAPWFIKDADGRYLKHSVTVPEMLGSKLPSFIGLTDNDLHLLSVSYRKSQNKINSITISEHAKVISLEIHRFENLPVYTPLIYITTPFLFNGCVYTLSRLVDICMLRTFNFLSHNSIFDGQESTDSTLERSVSSFSSINPVKLLNDSQWEILWLCLMGFSYRKISNMTGRTLKNTVGIISRALKKISLHTINNFLYVSKLYGWERFIPKSIQVRGLSKMMTVERIALPNRGSI